MSGKLLTNKLKSDIMNNKTKLICIKNYLDVLNMGNKIVEFELIQDDLDLEVTWKLNEDLTLKQAKSLNKNFYEFLKELDVKFSIWHEDCGIDSFDMNLIGICDY